MQLVEAGDGQEHPVAPAVGQLGEVLLHLVGAQRHPDAAQPLEAADAVHGVHHEVARLELAQRADRRGLPEGLAALLPRPGLGAEDLIGRDHRELGEGRAEAAGERAAPQAQPPRVRERGWTELPEDQSVGPEQGRDALAAGLGVRRHHHLPALLHPAMDAPRHGRQLAAADAQIAVVPGAQVHDRAAILDDQLAEVPRATQARPDLRGPLEAAVGEDRRALLDVEVGPAAPGEALEALQLGEDGLGLDDQEAAHPRQGRHHGVQRRQVVLGAREPEALLELLEHAPAGALAAAHGVHRVGGDLAGPRQGGLGDHGLPGGQHPQLLHGPDAPAGAGIDGAQAVHLVIEELDPDGALDAIGGPQVHHAPPGRSGPARGTAW